MTHGVSRPRMLSAPSLSDAMHRLDEQANALHAAAGGDKGFAHLLKLRASQINGCAYCVRLHAGDALADGESHVRIALVSAWRETTYFTAEERASFELVEAVTRIGDHGVLAVAFETAAAVLSHERILAVQWLATVINSWNRIAIASGTLAEHEVMAG